MSTAISGEQLAPTLTELLGKPVTSYTRRASPYATTHELDELTVEFANGSNLELMFKRLGSRAQLPGSKHAKPHFLTNPQRELHVYTNVLTDDLQTPHLYGTVNDPATDTYWLLIERVDGIELYQEGNFEIWKAAAAALAKLHETLKPQSTTNTQPLIHYDANLWKRWPERALKFATAEQKTLLTKITQRYDQIIAHLDNLPKTIIHNELYASNVLINSRNHKLHRFCPIDWEMAALGPAVVDLAALSTGWSEPQREQLATSYHAALTQPPPLKDFLTDLDFARLHLAIQWLGWSKTWRPPPEHRHDWFAEAQLVLQRVA